MSSYKVNLSKKVAVVTGGGGVLCTVFAKALAENGAKVAVLDINRDSAEKVADEIKMKNGKAIGIATDVLKLESLKKAKDRINKEFGLVNILINGAGGNNPKASTTKEYLFKEDLKNDSDAITFFSLDVKEIESTFGLNFIGTFLASQVFVRDLAINKGSSIVNISSMNAYTPLTKIPAYSAAKSAVSNFTQWLAVHLSKVEVRVNAIAPGFFLTNQNKPLLLKEDNTYTERAKKIINQTPMERFGKPEELVGTLLWLVDDNSSSFVNGITVPVDGGFSAYSGV
jgi:NAD(P)-dependent dehydrogenase (short-subunit alcohol dehydrogenase family)